MSAPVTDDGNEIRKLRQAVLSAGFRLDVNQAGPLLEQMASRGEVSISKMDRDFWVGWNGSFSDGNSILIAAMRCIRKATT